MKKSCISILLLIVFSSLYAQENCDSVFVTCNYKAESKEIVISVHNKATGVLYLTQFFNTPIGIGTQITIHSEKSAEYTSYALCQFIQEEYQSPQKFYKIESGRIMEFRNKLERFSTGDLLTVTIQICGFFNPYEKYAYTKILEVQL